MKSDSDDLEPALPSIQGPQTSMFSPEQRDLFEKLLALSRSDQKELLRGLESEWSRVGRPPGVGAYDDSEKLGEMAVLRVLTPGLSIRAAAREAAKDVPERRRPSVIDRLRKKYARSLVQLEETARRELGMAGGALTSDSESSGRRVPSPRPRAAGKKAGFSSLSAPWDLSKATKAALQQIEESSLEGVVRKLTRSIGTPVWRVPSRPDDLHDSALLSAMAVILEKQREKEQILDELTTLQNPWLPIQQALEKNDQNGVRSVLDELVRSLQCDAD